MIFLFFLMCWTVSVWWLNPLFICWIHWLNVNSFWMFSIWQWSLLLSFRLIYLVFYIKRQKSFLFLLVNNVQWIQYFWSVVRLYIVHRFQKHPHTIIQFDSFRKKIFQFSPFCPFHMFVKKGFHFRIFLSSPIS